MPVPMATVGSTTSRPHSRPVKRGRQRKAGVVSSCLDINSQLLEAVSQEKTSVVRRLISSGADPNTCSSAPTRDPALMLACSLPTVETRHLIMSLLLTKGANVDAANSVGQTALMRAALAGDVETCTLLLDASAKVGIEDCDGNTALSYAAENGHDEVTRMIVQVAKQKGCDVDHRNMKGLTPLLLACRNGHLSTACILVQEGGASPTIRDLDNFMTAAELMQKSGHYLESDLKFLYPVCRKKSYYRHQRQERGIRTLSDYLSGPANAFTIIESTDRDTGSCSSSRPLPPISPSPHPPPSPSRSMFDVPSHPPPSVSTPFRKKSLLPLAHRTPLANRTPKLSFSHDFKSDLYRSRSLKKRQLYVSPNRLSNCYHAGSLEPIAGDILERISHASTKAANGDGVETSRKTVEHRARGIRGGRGGGGGGGGEGKGKHNSLPPL